MDEGKIEAIEANRTTYNKPVNPGTVIGGIAGGVIGHQIGSGHGNTAATTRRAKELGATMNMENIPVAN